MISLIVSLVAGVLAGVLMLLFGAGGDLALIVGIGGTVVAFAAITGLSSGTVARRQADLDTLFPSEASPSAPATRRRPLS
jgi:uncharacterized membrane protein YeaQ/YmgE (transglycosylase-associated protein family)